MRLKSVMLVPCQANQLMVERQCSETTQQQHTPPRANDEHKRQERKKEGVCVCTLSPLPPARCEHL